MKPAILYIDNSTLRAAANCDTEAVVRYVLGLTTLEEKATLRSGSALHEAMAEYLRTEGDKYAAMNAFTVEYQVWAEENVPAEDRLSYANTARILDGWFELHPLAALPFRVEPTMVEIGFAFPLTAEGECVCGHHRDDHPTCCDCPDFLAIIFTGRLDGLARASHDGGLYVLENKSTGRINDVFIRRFRLDSQVTGYTWAAEQHFGEPILGVLINAIEFSKIPGSDKKCPTHAVAYVECGALHAQSKLMVVNRTPEKIRAWRKAALRLTDRYRRIAASVTDISQVKRLAMQGMFSGECVWCAFADWCAVDRPVELIGNMLQHDPWSPFDYAMKRRDETHHKP